MADNSPAVDLTRRILPPDEWDRLRTFGHFAKVGGLPSPQHALIEVLEAGDPAHPETTRIVGSWMAMNKVLLEGLHIEPEFRHNPRAARKLFFGMIDILKERGITQAMTITQDAYVARLARKAGFEPIDGAIHLLTLKGEG